MATTYYVALPFIQTEDGELRPGEAKECSSAAAAEREAFRLATSHAGAVAFSRTGDPATGEFSEATVLRVVGEVPTVDQFLAS
jgi:hypothetical protein